MTDRNITNDLVAKLRHWSREDDLDIGHEAADEIERLKKMHEDWFNGPNGVRWYMAENDRLRTALQTIAEGRGPFSTDQLTFATSVIETMKQTANEALGKAT